MLIIITCRSLRYRRDLRQGPGPPLTSSAVVPIRVTPFPCSWSLQLARALLSARPAAARNQDVLDPCVLATSGSTVHTAGFSVLVWSAAGPVPACPCARVPLSNHNKVWFIFHFLIITKCNLLSGSFCNLFRINLKWVKLSNNRLLDSV